MSEDDFIEKEKDENEFGPFGTGVKPVRFRFLMRHSHMVSFLMLLCMVPLILTGWYFLYWNYLETEPPFLEVTKLPPALGSSGNEISFRLRDRGTGLKTYEVRLTQGEKSILLAKRDFPKAKEDESISLVVNAKENGIEEGQATIVLSAKDRAFQENTSTLPVPLKVDFQAPSVEFLVGEKQFVQGGSGLVCYKVSETTDILSGVTIRAFIFPGQPAKGLHQDFAAFPNVYCAFFPIPVDLATPQDTMRVFIRDGAGNTSAQDRPLEVKALTTKTIDLRLSDAVVEDLEKKSKHAIDAMSYQLAEEQLLPLFSRPKSQAFWNGPFRRLSGDLLWVFGDNLRIQKPEGSVVVNPHEYFFTLAERTTVRASAEGVVIYADDLGVYGKTIIIDHGFGISTMYSHLLMQMKREGDRVSIGDEIGAAGMSGVASENGYGYSTRIHGISVKVSDWDDATSFARFYSEKLSELRKKLGIREVRFLE